MWVVFFILYVFISLFSLGFSSFAEDVIIASDEEVKPVVTSIIGGTPSKSNVVRQTANLILRWRRESEDVEAACTGTVLSRRWLLTAAHCLDPGRGFKILQNESYAFVGEADATLRIYNTKIRPYRFKQFVTHKDYNSSRTEYGSDLALIYLDRSIDKSVFLKVRLSSSRSSDPISGTKIYAAGYGLVENASPSKPQGTRADGLNEAPLTMGSFLKCKYISHPLLRARVSNAKQLCALPVDDGANGLTDVCSMDSGGPLFLDSKKEDIFQFAIISFSTTYLCAQNNSIGWFTRVSFYYDAIQQGIKQNYTEWKVHSV